MALTIVSCNNKSKSDPAPPPPPTTEIVDPSTVAPVTDPSKADKDDDKSDKSVKENKHGEWKEKWKDWLDFWKHWKEKLKDKKAEKKTANVTIDIVVARDEAENDSPLQEVSREKPLVIAVNSINDNNGWYFSAGNAAKGRIEAACGNCDFLAVRSSISDVRKAIINNPNNKIILASYSQSGDGVVKNILCENENIFAALIISSRTNGIMCDANNPQLKLAYTGFNGDLLGYTEDDSRDWQLFAEDLGGSFQDFGNLTGGHLSVPDQSVMDSIFQFLKERNDDAGDDAVEVKFDDCIGSDGKSYPHGTNGYFNTACVDGSWVQF